MKGAEVLLSMEKRDLTKNELGECNEKILRMCRATEDRYSVTCTPLITVDPYEVLIDIEYNYCWFEKPAEKVHGIMYVSLYDVLSYPLEVSIDVLSKRIEECIAAIIKH